MTPPDHRLMERELRAVGNILEGHEFQTTEELNAFLQESVRGKTLKWAPETASERAQELIYQAIENPRRKERVRLALQALEIFPNCADAYNLLADDAAESLEQARGFYQKGGRGLKQSTLAAGGTDRMHLKMWWDAAGQPLVAQGRGSQ